MCKAGMSRYPAIRLIRAFLGTSRSSVISRPGGSASLPVRRSSSQCNESANVSVRVAVPADYEAVMELMCKTYFRTEPSLVNIGLANVDEPPPPTLVDRMHRQVKEGLTLIAENEENFVIGAAVNAGSCPWEPDEIIERADTCETGNVRDIMKFYAHVTKAPKLWDKYCVLKIFECSHVGVHPNYLGIGIGKRLVRESWYLARDCGYKVFRIDCTSVYTAKIAEGFGWECVFSMLYRRYIDSGSLVFKCIREPHTEVRVYADRLLICKDYCITNPENCKIGTTPDGK